jgi:hypothetical protein
MKGTKLAALVLSAFLACSVTGVHAFANVPASAENDSTETEVIASRLGEDINAGAAAPDQVIGADGKPLTPEGNLSLVDDIITESGKQFITLTSRDGNYYYLIIDRSGNEDDNVYFLNKVDERDLLTLMDEEDVEEIEQARQEEAERLAAEAGQRMSAKQMISAKKGASRTNDISEINDVSEANDIIEKRCQQNKQCQRNK